MQPFDEAALNQRFLAKITEVKERTGDAESTISRNITGSKDRINNIKRGESSVDLKLLHNLEQVYGVDQHEIIKGVSIKAQHEELKQVAAFALEKLQEINNKLQ